MDDNNQNLEELRLCNKSDLLDLARGLATATANWLAERTHSGFTESLSNEALLIIPMVEYFMSPQRSKKWDLKGEWHELGISLAKAGDVNIDLVAEHQAEKILLEFKYLKKANDQRLIKDFVKLALPKNADYTRLLLIAHSQNGHNQGQSKSQLVQAITSAGGRAAFHLTMRDSLPEITSDLNKKHSLTVGGEGPNVSKIMKYDPSLSDFAVELVANCRKVGENVSVFSVSRI